MADFCLQCSVALALGAPEGWSDMAGVVADGETFVAVCEGCGVSTFDHEGRCLGPCSERHEEASHES